MDTWHQRLGYALAQRKKDVSDLMKVTGKKRPSVWGWLSGDTKMMEADNSAKICEYLKINPMWLFHGKMPSGLDIEVALAEPESPPDEESDTFRNQLLFFFNDLSFDHKDALVMLANRLHDINKPSGTSSKPFNRRITDKKPLTRERKLRLNKEEITQK